MTEGAIGRSALILKLSWKSTSHHGWFPSRERQGIHGTGVWVESRAGMDLPKTRESLAPSVSQPPDLPSGSLVTTTNTLSWHLHKSQTLQYAIIWKQINTHSFTDVKNLTVFKTSFYFLSYRRYTITWILNNGIRSPRSTQKYKISHLLYFVFSQIILVRRQILPGTSRHIDIHLVNPSIHRRRRMEQIS